MQKLGAANSPSSGTTAGCLGRGRRSGEGEGRSGATIPILPIGGWAQGSDTSIVHPAETILPQLLLQIVAKSSGEAADGKLGQPILHIPNQKVRVSSAGFSYAPPPALRNCSSAQWSARKITSFPFTSVALPLLFPPIRWHCILSGGRRRKFGSGKKGTKSIAGKWLSGWTLASHLLAALPCFALLPVHQPLIRFSPRRGYFCSLSVGRPLAIIPAVRGKESASSFKSSQQNALPTAE